MQKILFHFAMLKECPKSLIAEAPKNYYGAKEYAEGLEGLYDSIYDNLKIWVSGASPNRVLDLTPDLVALLSDCDQIFNFGLCGGISGDLEVGKIVAVDTVANLDLKMPGYKIGQSDNPTADILKLASYPSDSKQVACTTSNKFVTKDYLDFVQKDESSPLTAAYFADKNLSGLICDMELFYLVKLAAAFKNSMKISSFKMVSDLVIKDDNYSEYEGTLENLMDGLHAKAEEIAKNIA